jgi:iron(III) transport system permease protein
MGWLGLPDAPLPITTMGGMIWVEGVSLAPLFYIMSAGSFRAMDPSLEEAARASGASAFDTMRRVVIPLLAPAIMAAAIFTMTTALGAFDVPAIIGLSSKILTFSTLIYVKVSAVEDMPDYGTPAAFGTVITLLAILISIYYLKMLGRARQYQVVTGKGYRPRITKLGKYAILAWAFFLFYFACAILIPLALVVWSALMPVYQTPSLAALGSLSLASFSALPWGLLERGIVNSVLVSLGAPTLALIMSVAISWCVLRSKLRGRRHLDVIAFVPHAVPGIIFALGAVLGALFLLPSWIPLYGSVTVLVLVYSIGWITFGTRIVNSSLIQIHSDLEDASYASGASRLDTLRLIFLPLLWPALLGAWIYLALLAFRELTRAIILVIGDNVTLPVIVWGLWNTGAMNLASASILVMLAIFSPLVFIYFYFVKRP